MMLNNFLIQLRENARLRWGVALIVGTCWLYGLLLIQEALQTEARLHRSANLSLARTRAQMTQTEWLARVAPAKTLAVQLESRLWRAATAMMPPHPVNCSMAAISARIRPMPKPM